LTKGNS